MADDLPFRYVDPSTLYSCDNSSGVGASPRPLGLDWDKCVIGQTDKPSEKVRCPANNKISQRACRTYGAFSNIFPEIGRLPPSSMLAQFLAVGVHVKVPGLFTPGPVRTNLAVLLGSLTRNAAVVKCLQTTKTSTMGGSCRAP